MDLILNYLGFSVGVNLLMFVIAYIFQTDKITDISYSVTFIAIAAFGLFQSEHSLVDIIFFALVLIWGVRLGSYLMYRIHKIGKDDRFDHIRVNFVSFLFFWVMQGLTCCIVMIPIILSFQSVAKVPSGLFLIGLVISILGLIIELIADQQKFQFKLKQPDKFMSSGLFKYVQHPNYAGELLFWWGILLASLSYTNWYVSLIGPLWITFIIVAFSGVRILQRNWKERYGADPDFQLYQKQTSKIIPGIY